MASTYRVLAHNTATASSNKIHDDEVARAYGFSGGLVPGVDVYAYLTHLPAAEWGLDWLRRGTIAARFARPVYDGDEITVEAISDDGGLGLTLRDSAGEVCATATATATAEGNVTAPPPEPGAYPAGDVPDELPPASPQSLAAGTVLAPVVATFHAERAGEYLAEVREDLPLYGDEGVAHPGWLLRFANGLLVANVVLGPWIHVGSDVHFLDVVRDGEQVDGRARVVDEHERKGHRFVVLDVLLTTDGRPVQQVTHTAIHTPRPPAPATP